MISRSLSRLNKSEPHCTHRLQFSVSGRSCISSRDYHCLLSSQIDFVKSYHSIYFNSFPGYTRTFLHYQELMKQLQKVKIHFNSLRVKSVVHDYLYKKSESRCNKRLESAKWICLFSQFSQNILRNRVYKLCCCIHCCCLLFSSAIFTMKLVCKGVTLWSKNWKTILKTEWESNSQWRYFILSGWIFLYFLHIYSIYYL